MSQPPRIHRRAGGRRGPRRPSSSASASGAAAVPSPGPPCQVSPPNLPIPAPPVHRRQVRPCRGRRWASPCGSGYRGAGDWSRAAPARSGGQPGVRLLPPPLLRPPEQAIGRRHVAGRPSPSSIRGRRSGSSPVGRFARGPERRAGGGFGVGGAFGPGGIFDRGRSEVGGASSPRTRAMVSRRLRRAPSVWSSLLIGDVLQGGGWTGEVDLRSLAGRRPLGRGRVGSGYSSHETEGSS
jgi:hypothetical protein